MSGSDFRSWFQRFGDPGYRYGVALADVVGRLLLRLASAEVLPFDYTATADAVTRYLEDLPALVQPAEPEVADRVREAVQSVAEASGRLRIEAVYLNRAVRRLLARGADDLAGRGETLRELNALLMQAERDLIDERGLPRRPWYRYLIDAPGYYEGYAAKALPGVREALEESEWELAIEQASRLVEGLRRVTSTVARATDVARAP